jgi:hypothetical protein
MVGELRKVKTLANYIVTNGNNKNKNIVYHFEIYQSIAKHLDIPIAASERLYSN